MNKTTIAALGVAAVGAIAILTGCAETKVEPFQEIQVELDNGDTASCIVYTTTDTDPNDNVVEEVEEMSCRWPNKK